MVTQNIYIHLYKYHCNWIKTVFNNLILLSSIGKNKIKKQYNCTANDIYIWLYCGEEKSLDVKLKSLNSPLQ